MKGVALVTGAGRGLGRIIATFLAGQGHDIVITARTSIEIHDVAQFLEGNDVRIVPIPGDITDPVHRTRLLQQTRAMGSLSLLVNNASDLGEIPRPELALASLERFRLTLETNLVAPIALIQESPSAPQRGAAVRALQEVTAPGGNLSSPIRGTQLSSPDRGMPGKAEGPLARALGIVLDAGGATAGVPAEPGLPWPWPWGRPLPARALKPARKPPPAAQVRPGRPQSASSSHSSSHPSWVVPPQTPDTTTRRAPAIVISRPYSSEGPSLKRCNAAISRRAPKRP